MLALRPLTNYIEKKSFQKISLYLSVTRTVSLIQLMDKEQNDISEISQLTVEHQHFLEVCTPTIIPFKNNKNNKLGQNMHFLELTGTLRLKKKSFFCGVYLVNTVVSHAIRIRRACLGTSIWPVNCQCMWHDEGNVASFCCSLGKRRAPRNVGRW